MGAFSFKTDVDDSLILRVIEIGTNLRSRYLSLPYGDQGLFIYKRNFFTLGKFPAVTFMEDFDFVMRARKYGKIRILGLFLITSARRWSIHGIIWNSVNNQVLLLVLSYLIFILYLKLIVWGRLVGVPLDTLATW